MKNRTFLVTALACTTLSLGSLTYITRAADSTDADMEKLQVQAKEQDKEQLELMANFNDQTFVRIASMANTDELKAGEAALKMTKNDDVKMLAQHMIDDHTKVGEAMKSLAEKKDWKTSEMCDAKHQMALQQMSKLSGGDFDRAYAVAQVKDHEDVVSMFKMASEKASDADLKMFAEKNLPTLKEHLKMARDVAGKLQTMPVK